MDSKLTDIFSQRLSLKDIKQIVSKVSLGDFDKTYLWALANSEDYRIRINALWAMTHLAPSEILWLESLQDKLIDKLLTETNVAGRRIILQLLREQEYKADHIRGDFLDFCFSKINAECEPYAIRASCIYCSYKMSRHYPELIAELNEHLDILSYQPVSPGLKSALRQTKTKIDRLNK